MTKFLWKELSACKQQVNSALEYLEQPKKRHRWTPTICFGPRSTTTQELIRKICSSKTYPPLPILLDNKELREQTKPREKSPLFRVASSAISLKYSNLKAEIKAAIQEEKEKTFISNVEFPLRIESTSDTLPEEKELAETLDTEELSDKL